MPFSKKVISTVKRDSPGAITIADVGANLGLYSFWFQRKFGPETKIFAFEPAPEILASLKDNIDLNQFTNIKVIAAACADRVGTIEFYIGAHHHQSSIHAKWAGDGKIIPTKVTAQCTTLDHYFESIAPPQIIKIDIEGGATLALKGCQRILKNNRPILFIESHTPEEDRAISDTVVENDYLAFRVQTHRRVTQLKEIHPNPEGIWGNLLLFPKESPLNKIF